MPPKIQNFELRRLRWFMRLQFVNKWGMGFARRSIGQFRGNPWRRKTVHLGDAAHSHRAQSESRLLVYRQTEALGHELRHEGELNL